MSRSPGLTAREVYQVLKDLALGVRTVRLTGVPDSTDAETWLIDVAIDDWQLRLVCVDTQLQRCERCRSPDARYAGLADWQRFGTDPVDFLSQWEQQQLTGLLTALRS